MRDTTTTTIIVEPVAGRPGYFAATLNGETLCTSHEPLLASAWILLARGRHRLSVRTVLNEMQQRGASLRMQFATGRVLWSTSTGLFVTVEAASELINRPDIVPVGDPLFPNGPSQTYRYVDNPKGTYHV